MTSTTAVDVNQAFAGEKQAQIAGAYQRVEDNRRAIADYESGLTQSAMDAKLAADVASGKIKLLGGDRYMVLTGYDANETFRVQRATRPGEMSLVLPETGLDYVDGKAQVFSAVETWHNEGNVKTGVISISELLKLSGLGFKVEKAPSLYEAGGELREAEGEFITFRDDTFAKLGAVGSIYRPFQNSEGAQFLQDLVERYDVQFESAGTLNGGKQVFISMNLPDSVVIDEGGLNDVIEPKLCWLNNHDGEGKLKCVVGPWRPVCGNTNRFALRDAVTSWGIRHTTNGLQRLEEARRSLGFSLKYYTEFADEETILARTALDLKEFDELIASIWPATTDEPSKRQVTLTTRREDALHELWGLESGRAGRTAYAAENAVTGYLDHVAPRRALGDKLAAARATAILLGADDDIKSKAHRQLLTLANR
jgi:phage/plasmid-like protein (TIGR03299 family)